VVKISSQTKETIFHFYIDVLGDSGEQEDEKEDDDDNLDSGNQVDDSGLKK
jgi:hypothetical protein